MSQDPRIQPLQEPYSEDVATMLAKWMPPGSAVEPLRLFRTLAVHEQLSSRMRPLGAGILGPRALVEPLLREVMIARTCALTGRLLRVGSARGRLREAARTRRRAAALQRPRHSRGPVLGRALRERS